MRSMLIAAIVVLLWSAPATADTWACRQPDGSILFTYSPSAGCTLYRQDEPGPPRSPEGKQEIEQKDSRKQDCLRTLLNKTKPGTPTTDDVKADMYLLKTCLGDGAEKDPVVSCIEQTVRLLESGRGNEATRAARQYFEQCRR